MDRLSIFLSQYEPLRRSECITYTHCDNATYALKVDNVHRIPSGVQEAHLC